MPCCNTSGGFSGGYRVPVVPPPFQLGMKWVAQSLCICDTMSPIPYLFQSTMSNQFGSFWLIGSVK